ncbi:MAG: NAD(P)-dependent alcohol dehydrogenase [Synergistaceae bacterium]|jgi:threonine dehydrogenase-like Zn-dependent dehydrogenase|nr:NAD(P)-dependent alcohol dehydrogenase [Synergistaceae bacterium]
MKGFAMLKLGEVGWIEKEKPTAGPMDAIVRPLALSPCTSDVHTVWESAASEKRNIIMGHEAVGEVVEVGSLVKDFKPGDKVIVPAITPDWGAVASQMGYSQHSNGMLGGMKFSTSKDGVFGEFFHVNEADGNMAILPDNVSIEEAVMLTDMVPTGFHGADNAEVSYGETIAVIGIGPVGLMAVAGSNLRGAARIFAVGSRPVCVEAAKKYGATDIVNYKDGDISDQIKEAMKGRGVDKVIIAGGGVETFEQAVKIIRPAGIISNVNYFSSGDCIKIPRVAWGLGMSHIRIIGGLMPGGRKNMEYLSNLLKYKKLDVTPLLTHRYKGFEHIEEALLLMKNKTRDLIKPVVTI